jgi:hypothetical protein
LIEELDGRSEGSVELKHQNISAVLRDLGYFWIPGYKPRSNYQERLAVEVERWVTQNPDLDGYALAAAEAPAAAPEHFDFEGFQVSSPPLREGAEAGVREYQQASYQEGPRVAMRRDYAAREAYNTSLGRAGEELIYKFEKHRLLQAGHTGLAAKVEHVARTQGDGLGFDILSFEESGEERFIEVKTTTFAKETPFFASAAEIRFAQRNARRFALFRLFDFRRKPKCFALPGQIESQCALDPFTYRCAFR